MRATSSVGGGARGNSDAPDSSSRSEAGYPSDSLGVRQHPRRHTVDLHQGSNATLEGGLPGDPRAVPPMPTGAGPNEMSAMAAAAAAARELAASSSGGRLVASAGGGVGVPRVGAPYPPSSVLQGGRPPLPHAPPFPTAPGDKGEMVSSFFSGGVCKERHLFLPHSWFHNCFCRILSIGIIVKIC